MASDRTPGKPEKGNIDGVKQNWVKYASHTFSAATSL
jgi:hypothetical protein